MKLVPMASTATNTGFAPHALGTTTIHDNRGATRRSIEGDCGICMLPFEADPDFPPPEPPTDETSEDEPVDEAEPEYSAEATGVTDSEILGESEEEDEDAGEEDGQGGGDHGGEYHHYLRPRIYVSDERLYIDRVPAVRYIPPVYESEDSDDDVSDVEMTDAIGEIDYEALMTSNPNIGEDDELESDDEDVDDEADEGDEGEKGSGIDLERLVWCSSGCGTNYHRACINNWLAMFGLSARLPTCPTCRTVWQID